MVKEIDILWDVFVICMSNKYGYFVRNMEKEMFKAVGKIIVIVCVAFQEERFCKRKVWKCVQAFGDMSNKIDVFSEFGE